MRNEIKTLKVLTVVGTRPEIIRLSETMKLADKLFDQIIVHTGQNYDKRLNEIFFSDLNIRKPNYYLNAAKGTPVETVGNIFISLEKIILKEKPDIFLVLGDTNSALSAYVAKRNKIPIFHIEAGNRCFDQRVPEEINRKIVDHISDIHITYSKISRDYLIREGVPPDTIVKLGSPMKEIIAANSKKIKKSLILQKMNIKKNNFILISVHREENLDSDEKLIELIKALHQVHDKYKKQIIISLHPRTKKRIDNLKLTFDKNFIISEPFNYSDYIKLQINSFLVISDSGTINEEASILKFRAINLRDAHERPESSEQASTVMSSVSSIEILQSCDLILKNKISTFDTVTDYDVNNFSFKMCRTIQSYYSYVNRSIWKNY